MPAFRPATAMSIIGGTKFLVIAAWIPLPSMSLIGPCPPLAPADGSIKSSGKPISLAIILPVTSTTTASERSSSPLGPGIIIRGFSAGVAFSVGAGPPAFLALAMPLDAEPPIVKIGSLGTSLSLPDGLLNIFLILLISSGALAKASLTDFALPSVISCSIRSRRRAYQSDAATVGGIGGRSPSRTACRIRRCLLWAAP